MATQIGTRIGKLEIQQLIGEGGMGAVYLARHVVLNKPRAIKLLLPELTRSEVVVQRFINEARAAASIAHRNIIAVDDCDQLPSGDWYIVMEWLDGGTLGGFVRSNGGPLSAYVTLQIVAQIANGLEAAHRKGIVHRDLKPENVFLTTRDGNDKHVVILDFGIARFNEPSGGQITRTGQTLGTPAYMAPEQLRGAKVDHTCDVFALAVIAYQMITGGWWPYQEGGSPVDYYELTSAEIYHRQMMKPALDPRDRFAGVGDGWATAILAALDRDPTRRPQSARAFALALADATPGDGYQPRGIEVVRTYARELLDADDQDATVRAAKPVGGTGATPTISRYQLGSKIGVGGMAEVFTGSIVGAEGFARPVAIKRVLPGFSELTQFATMFIQEAQIASQLSHPNVVSILDFDRDPEGRLFLVMEWIDGKDLAALLVTGVLPVSAVIFVVSQILRGLGYAHDLPNPTSSMRGVVHRDVSPQNVLLSWEGSVKLSDFGIAKALEMSAGARSEMIKGKPGYMSPEQANGEALDNRSDLFAVGTILWEMLTGRSLFAGSPKEALAQVLFRPIPRPRTIRPDVPMDLEAVAMKLLERERDARYANAELAIEDLARCADNPRNGPTELVRLLAGRFPVEVAARSAKPATPRVAAQMSAALPSTLGAAASQAVARARPRPRRWPWLAGAAAIAATGIAVIALQRGSGPSRGDDAVAASVVHRLDAAAPLPARDAALVAAAVVDAAVRPPSPPVDASLAQPIPIRPPPHVVPARPITAQAIGSGTLTIKIRPWAETVIDGRAAGETPVRATLSAGRHRVLISNDAMNKNETIYVTIEPGKETTIERIW